MSLRSRIRSRRTGKELEAALSASLADLDPAIAAWTEAITRIGGGVSDVLFAEASGQFCEKELADLTWAVAAINAWNRVAISFRSVPGVYQPKNPSN